MFKTNFYKMGVKYYLNVNKISFVILILPFLAFNRVSIYNSGYFTLTNLFIISLLFLIIEVSIIYLLSLNIFNRKSYSQIFTLLILNLIYCYYITIIIQNYILNYFNLNSRFYVILFYFVINFVFYLILKKIKNQKFINIFFLIFSFINFITPNKIEEYKELKSNFVFDLNNQNKIIKPIILIILDEYNSPDGLYKINKDSTLYDLSKKLNKNKWIVKNNFYSYETSTIHSLSSLFNFNLSKNGLYKLNNVNQIAKNKILKNLLYEDLKRKKIKIVNFGIFDFGKSKPLNRLYFYPKNFFEAVFANSIYHYYRNFIKMSLYPMQNHNKYIYKKMPDSLFNIKYNFFVYTHLYMPHSPIIYEPEIKLKKNTFDNYIEFWRFTNNKIEPIIEKLTKNNNYRIIITGDHGYKGGVVNPNYTFSAFWGFNKFEVDKIKSVQDIGILINDNF